MKYYELLPEDQNDPVNVELSRYAGEYFPLVEKTPEKRRKKSRTGSALLLAFCMVLSMTFGFLGGYLAHVQTAGDPAPAAPAPQANLFIPTTSYSGEGLTVPEVAALTAPSVVEITTESTVTDRMLRQFVSQGAGSGVIISSDGYIVTNNHVVEGASRVTVRMNDLTTYTAKIVGADSQTDIAVLKIEATGLSPAVFGDSSKLVVGETAIAIGNPLGELGGTVTDGIISALDRTILIDGESMVLLQTNAAINPGNSGGGLFNMNGELVGIVNAKSSGSDIEGLGFAIPSNTAKSVINELISYGYVRGRVDLGAELLEISDTMTAMMYRVSTLGVYVYDTTSDSSPLQSGDRIVSVNGTGVSSLSDVKAALKDLKVGDKIPVTVVRARESLDLTITLTELTA